MFAWNHNSFTFPGMDSTCIYKRPNTYRCDSPWIKNKHVNVLDGRIPDCSNQFFPVPGNGRQINISKPNPASNIFNSPTIHTTAFIQIRWCMVFFSVIRRNGNHSHRNTDYMAIPQTTWKDVKTIILDKKAEHIINIPLSIFYKKLSILFLFIREITCLHIFNIVGYSIMYHRTQISVTAQKTR